MRTSRIAKETDKMLHALPTLPPRRTRRLAAFALDPTDSDSSLSSIDTVDIEDILPRKRRRITAETVKNEGIKNEPEPEVKEVKQNTKEKKKRLPARRIKGADGSVTVSAPSNWEVIYETVKKMRAANPTAPVDTMGCAELHWRASAPRDQRFQTLIALMLSSQTKDTVTAVAMQRLHTELGVAKETSVKEEIPIKEETSIQEETRIKEETPIDIPIKEERSAEETPIKEIPIKEETPIKKEDSTLNLANILAVSPERLNELIRTVGFHNNKTKYIKAAALIIRDQYGGDIPPTATELMKLPGVGPKMAFLCMSAAWGKTEGIGVDVHVHRITNLWGWHTTRTPEETRLQLEAWLPREKWHEINKLLVGLGQTVCLPVGRRCGECDLAGTKLCKSEVRGSKR
ncbi:hypothetical protein ASPZODRAFT_136980 [Penicilliopsis zonata CBS 506.65]|uniref:Endonuclease III homolog n=1 Tax=Penicilliopsis zonata CBS 506.65 TaxID=1073090 RepID=A0A1L9S6Q8_9EURO|nr:hypothetical protein ASPZODRAFT_136980 [Penicilliopsis zonata CBS 506.65]OJJ42840.1 hypothetical protein ASPZODRAFT_136980 [Penicilliopsis zonata CBS 506.65]